jgi:hypothetical protein
MAQSPCFLLPLPILLLHPLLFFYLLAGVYILENMHPPGGKKYQPMSFGGKNMKRVRKKKGENLKEKGRKRKEKGRKGQGNEKRGRKGVQ